MSYNHQVEGLWIVIDNGSPYIGFSSKSKEIYKVSVVQEQMCDSISLGVVSPIPPSSYSRQAQRVWLIKKDDGASVLVIKDNESKENWFEGVIHQVFYFPVLPFIIG